MHPGFEYLFEIGSVDFSESIRQSDCGLQESGNSNYASLSYVRPFCGHIVQRNPPTEKWMHKVRGVHSNPRTTIHVVNRKLL